MLRNEIWSLLMTQLGHAPQAWVPPPQLLGPPSRQSSEQLATLLQCMTQGPSHSMVQDDVEAQSIVLPGPTRALQSVAFEQSKTEPGPQIAPQRSSDAQLTVQFASQAAEQPCMSWQRTVQSSSQTVPQRSTL